MFVKLTEFDHTVGPDTHWDTWINMNHVTQIIHLHMGTPGDSYGSRLYDARGETICTVLEAPVIVLDRIKACKEDRSEWQK